MAGKEQNKKKRILRFCFFFFFPQTVLKRQKKIMKQKKIKLLFAYLIAQTSFTFPKQQRTKKIISNKTKTFDVRIFFFFFFLHSKLIKKAIPHTLKWTRKSIPPNCRAMRFLFCWEKRRGEKNNIVWWTFLSHFLFSVLA